MTLYLHQLQVDANYDTSSAQHPGPSDLSDVHVAPLWDLDGTRPLLNDGGYREGEARSAGYDRLGGSFPRLPWPT